MGNDVVAFKSWLDAHRFSNPCAGEKPFSSIGQKWSERKRTLDSDTRSWSGMLS